MPNAPAAHVAMRHGVHGPVLTYSVACASSAVALAEAAKAVRRGDVDVAIAGGAEALIVPGVVSAWQAHADAGRFEPGEAASACRPFASDRSGFALGEGAAFVVLESAERARRRGAPRLCRARGLGHRLRCHPPHQARCAGPGARAARRAGRRAGRSRATSATATRTARPRASATCVERSAGRGVGRGARDLRVSSTKALHGHLLGAAGALEAVITVLALQRRQLPPNAHCASPDASCALNLVLQPAARAANLRAAVSSSFAFGGSNAVLAFKRV